MTLGVGLFLVAVGAILYFAVNASVEGFEVSTAGVILMVVGAFGALAGLLLRSREDNGYKDEYL